MNGCYLFTGMPAQNSHQSFDNFNANDVNNKNSNLNSNFNDYENANMNYDDELMFKKRKRRNSDAKKANESTRIDDLRNFCSRYVKLEKSVECNVNFAIYLFLRSSTMISFVIFKKIIPGAYALGTGYDIKYENNENSRRRSVILRYCNYQK